MTGPQFLIGVKTPEWWREFILMVNEWFLYAMYVISNFTVYHILWLMAGFWFAVMSFWVRQFSTKIMVFYWIFVIAYFIVGGWFVFTYT